MKFILVTLCAVGFYLYWSRWEKDSCSRLLTDGYFNVNKTYQPTGCMMHNYSAREAKQCFQMHNNTHGKKPFIVFVGDSRIRQQFNGLKSLLLEQPYKYTVVHKDIFFNVSMKEGYLFDQMHQKEVKNCQEMGDIDRFKASVLFVTTTGYYMVTSSLFWEKSQILQTIESSSEFRWKPSQEVSKFIQNWQSVYKKHGPPVFVVIGIGLHFIGSKKNKVQEETAFGQYKDTMTKLVEQMSLIQDTKFVWMMQDPVKDIKVDKELSRCNDFVTTLLDGKDIMVWRSSRHLSLKFVNESPTKDGWHLGKSGIYWDVQILMNLFCNNIIHPPDATCCKKPDYDIAGQIVYMVLFIVCLIISIAVRRLTTTVNKKEQTPTVLDKSMMVTEKPGSHLIPNKTGHSPEKSVDKGTSPLTVDSHTIVHVDKEDSSGNGSQPYVILTVIWSIFKYAGLMGYFYLCDRSEVFSAENKLYQSQHFYIPLGVLLVLGILTIRKSTSNEILNRQQTDEWKGWMQLVILVYHYTGASQDLQIYMHVRVLVSSYLFMTGYGHVMYALKHTEATIRQIIWRSCEVLFRMNFLTMALCIVMGKSYQFYYFVPLVSFWFICIMFITWIPIRLTSYLQQMNTGKGDILTYSGAVFSITIMCFTINTALHKNKELFNFIFSYPVIKFFFKRENGSTEEWFFRWSTDRYSSLYGIIVGVVLVVFKHLDMTAHLHKCCHIATVFLVGLISIPGLLIYQTTGDICSTKPKCNSFHPLSCVIPIISYIVLRNISHCMRSYNSLFFTWVGKISLELFISQYHIWLAADTTGLLVLIPGYPLVNFAVTTLIFVCVAHEINSITATLTRLIFHKPSQ